MKSNGMNPSEINPHPEARRGLSRCGKCRTTIDKNTGSCNCPQGEEPSVFLIWCKNHGGLWYRPDSAGYTDNPDVAGRYTEVQASNAHVGTHGDCVGYLENSPFVARKRNEYLQQKRRATRSCLEGMTPQQALDIMSELVKERIDLWCAKEE